MDWSVPSEMIEALESAGGDSCKDLQEEEDKKEEAEAEEEEEEAKGERCKPDTAAHKCKEEGGVFTAVEDILATVCEAGEKLFVSVSSWVPWRSDESQSLSSADCPQQSQKEIQLIERTSTPHHSPRKLAHSACSPCELPHNHLTSSARTCKQFTAISTDYGNIMNFCRGCRHITG